MNSLRQDAGILNLFRGVYPLEQKYVTENHHYVYSPFLQVLQKGVLGEDSCRCIGSFRSAGCGEIRDLLLHFCDLGSGI